MLRWYLGAATGAAAAASMAVYLAGEERPAEHARLAQYYAGEAVPDPLSPLDTLAQQVVDASRAYPEVLDELLQHTIEGATAPVDPDHAEAGLRSGLTDAIARARLRGGMAPPAGGRRQDMSPALMAALAVPADRAMTLDEVAGLLSGRRADGGEIEGRQRQRPMRALTAVYGLDGRRLPSVTEIGNVLDGKRADGQAPTGKDGNPLPDGVLAGARKRFLAAYSAGREPTEAQLAHIRAGRTANGLEPDAAAVKRALNATKAPIAYADMIWSADKSVSVGWALAETQAERSAIEQAHNQAVAGAMAYVEQFLGVTRLGKAGSGGTARGEVAWLEFRHYASRPTMEFARIDQDSGEAYTEFVDVHAKTADPQLHTHTPLLNAVRTDSGKIGAIDWDLLDSRTKEFGRVYQAVLATGLQKLGCRVELDRETGAAVLADIPRELCETFSRRRADAKAAAREAATEAGLDWDAMSPDRQRSFLQKGVETSRNRKEKGDGPAQFARWKEAARATGYRHQSVIGRAAAPDLSHDARLTRAFDVALDLVEGAFSKKAVLNALQLREAAAAALIGVGSETVPDDINALTRAMRKHGVRQDGETVGLVWGDDTPQRGKPRISVTTRKHLASEQFVRETSRRLANDHSAALPRATVEHAIGAFLEKRREIEPASQPWQAQRQAIDALADGRMLGLVIGVAGAGKSTITAPVFAAMHAEGRDTYGIANAWRHAAPLGAAGAQRTASVAAFLSRIEREVYRPATNATVVLDEMSRIGLTEMTGLLQAQQKHGFQLLMIGDPKQCQAIDPQVMDLLLEALGKENIPEILTSVRQKTGREQEIAGLFRDGRAAEAIALKREDGTAELVAGGRERTIERVAALWRERMQARGDEPDFVLTVSAPTNQDAQAISQAIRQQAREMGRLTGEPVTIQAAGPKHLGEVTTPMPLAAGDQVRVFTRVIVDRKGFASNGDVLRLREVAQDSVRAVNERGEEASLTWSRFQQKGGVGPIRLTYGYAATIDLSQGQTSTEHIDALVSGSAASQRNKGYVAESRQRDRTWMVVSEAAERREIMARVPRGAPLPALTHDDIWQNVSENLSRTPTKSTATAFLERVQSVFSGMTRDMQTAMVRPEQAFRAAHPAPFRQPEPQAGQASQLEAIPEPPPLDRVPDHELWHEPQAGQALQLEAIPEPPPLNRVPDHELWREDDQMPDWSDIPPPGQEQPGETPATAGSDRNPGQRNRPNAPTKAIDPAGSQADFLQAMEQIGLRIQGAPRADSQRHPVAVEGNRGRRKSGFYRFDGVHGFGMNSRTGEKASWYADGTRAEPRSEAQREADRQARAEQQRQQLERARRTADQAKVIWGGTAPASPAHAYLVKKQIAPGDIRQGRPDQFATFEKEDGTRTRVSLAGRLIIPLRDADGEIWNIQAIGRGGGKLFLAGRTKGLSYQIGTPSRPDEPVILAEGFATARTLHEISGLSAVVALGAGNLPPVAEAIRKREPGRPIIIGSDNDHQTERQGQPNVGLKKARETAELVGGMAVPPPFQPHENGSDWNDLVVLRGRAGARDALGKGLEGIALPPMPLAPVIPNRADEPVQPQRLPRDYSRYQERQVERAVSRDMEQEVLRERETQQEQARKTGREERGMSLGL